MKLRIVSYNIRGLTGQKLEQLLQLARDTHLDIIMLQETHLYSTLEHEHYLQQNGWTSVWHNQKRQKRRKGGVAILVNNQSQHQYSIKLTGNTIKTAQGRIVGLNMEWEGHKIQLICGYMPNKHQDTTKLVEKHLEGLFEQTVGKYQEAIWAGDWNFVEDPINDTSSSKRRYNKQEQSLRTRWKELLGQMTECNGEGLRQNKVYTAYKRTQHGRVGSRIDRFYSSQGLTNFIRGVRLLNVSKYNLKSDHTPMLLELHPRACKSKQMAKGYRLQRVKTALRKSETHLNLAKTELNNFILSLEMNDPSDIIELWPTIKYKVTVICNYYSSMYEKELKTKIEQFREDEQDPVLIHEQQKQKYALATANHTGSKVHLKNDILDKSLHQFLSGHKRKVNLPPLRNCLGREAKSMQGNVEILVDHYAAISKEPETNSEIQEDMLNLIPPRATKIFQECDGNEMVNCREVKNALQKLNPLTAPGEDGIKLVIYRSFKDILAPMLAQLFTAILRYQIEPRKFKDGIIRPIPKGTISPDASMYRPITLLNVDHKIFTFILKERLVIPLNALIPETQTAFLPGRHSAENIWIQQSIPPLLAKDNNWALMVLCDFQKAYDTIDRRFLYKICTKLQMPDTICRWISLILANTRNRVYASSHISSYRTFIAGIRQGCPVSPLLYLLVAYVLHLTIQESNIGLTINCPISIPPPHCHPQPPEPIHLNIIQYADDSKIYLKDQDQVPTLLAVLENFAAATGQHLNKEKTHVLGIGAIPQDLPDDFHGLQRVQIAKVLGIGIQEGIKPPIVDWEKKLNCLERYAQVVRANPISIFGKCALWRMFALSQLTYAGEFTEIPEEVMCKINQLTKSLLPAIACKWTIDQMSTRQDEGGLGILNFSKHLEARRGKWSISLILQGTTTIWSKLIWNLYIQQFPVDIIPIKCLKECTLPDLTTKIQGTLYLRSFKSIIQRLVCQAKHQNHSKWDPKELFWQHGRKNISMSQYTVKIGTKLLTTEDHVKRKDKYLISVFKICREIPALDNRYLSLYKDLWSLKMSNKWKEPFWHVTAGAMIESQEACPCGTLCGMTIEHSFQHCPIAQHIYSLFGVDQIYREKLALSILTGTPPPHVPKQLWHYLCIIAVYAIDAGRRHIYQLKYHPQGKPKSAYEIVQKGKAHASQNLWRLVTMHCSRFPPAKDNSGQFPIVYWDSETATWHPRAR
jgi:exonuclease III